MSRDDRLAVGLAGAGPWARAVHAPVFAAGPETRLAGVWSRTREHAEALATTHGAPAIGSFDALLECCDAVAFAVPPDVQPELAVRAARAGKAVLLEKPLALDTAGAERVAKAVAENGVGSMMVLTYRFAPAVRQFLTRAAKFDTLGARACFLSGAFLSGEYASSPWRVQHGALLDVGPHILDLVDAAVGRVIRVQAQGNVHDWISVVLHHETGAISDVSISCRAAITPSRTEVELFGPEGTLSVDGRADQRAELFANLRVDFVGVAQDGRRHPCDAEHGLYLQRLLTATEFALASGRITRV